MSNFQAMRESDRDNVLLSTDERAEEITYTPHGFGATPGTALTINAYVQREEQFALVNSPNGRGQQRIFEATILVGRGATTGVETLSDDDKFTIDGRDYKPQSQPRGDRSVRMLKLAAAEDVEHSAGQARRPLR